MADQLSPASDTLQARYAIERELGRGWHGRSSCDSALVREVEHGRCAEWKSSFEFEAG